MSTLQDRPEKSEPEKAVMAARLSFHSQQRFPLSKAMELAGFTAKERDGCTTQYARVRRARLSLERELNTEGFTLTDHAAYFVHYAEGHFSKKNKEFRNEMTAINNEVAKVKGTAMWNMTLDSGSWGSLSLSDLRLYLQYFQQTTKRFSGKNKSWFALECAQWSRRQVEEVLPWSEADEARLVELKTKTITMKDTRVGDVLRENTNVVATNMDSLSPSGKKALSRALVDNMNDLSPRTKAELAEAILRQRA